MSISCKYFKHHRCRSCSLLAPKGAFEPTATALPELHPELARHTQTLSPWVRCSSPIASRAKAKLTVSGTIEAPIIGILDAQLKGVELHSCLLHKESINVVAKELPALLRSNQVSPYNIATRDGELKGVIIQTNAAETAIRIRFVVKSEAARAALNAVSLALQALLGQTVSTSLNIQPIPHQIPEGPVEIPLLGPDFLWEHYGSVLLALPAQSFMQVTPEVAAKLYDAACAHLTTYGTGPVRVLDMFCGAGGFALHVASHASQVTGVELSPHAIEAAKASANRNKLENITFIAGSSEDSLNLLSENNVVICNPPRRGLGAALTQALLRHQPQCILYSSCNVDTLLADYELLKEHYVWREATPFEMFPLTTHYEVLAVFTLRERD